MSLPILSAHAAITDQDLLRYYHRIELHWSRHLSNETTLDVGTALSNPQLGAVFEANRVLDFAVPPEMTPAEAANLVESHFAGQGVRCAEWVPSPTPERAATAAGYLLSRGLLACGHDVMCLRRSPVGVADMAGLQVIPARAAFRHFRTLVEERAAEHGISQLADASMLHLDDPHCDALMALRDGVPAAAIAVMAVGELGCAKDLFVSQRFRRQGIGRMMLGRAMEICARSLFKHVFVGVSDEAHRALYTEFGFRQIGTFLAYRAQTNA